MKLYIRSSRAIEAKVSDKDYSNSITGTAYKVFVVRNGKLYPPKVANAGGEATPTGVWLDAEEGDFVELDGLKRIIEDGGTSKKRLLERIANLDNLDPQARAEEVQSLKKATLAYRPGWHLGDEPRAKQFDCKYSWQAVELEESDVVTGTVNTYNSFINRCVVGKNVGNIYYVKDVDEYFQVVDDNAPYFPYNFVWAECEYVMDIDYQAEAEEQGYMRTKPDGTKYKSDKYQHSAAGLQRIPENGSYKYRTNPNPDTVPWVITGAIRVSKLLDDADVRAILGNRAPERQGGDKTLAELGLTQI